MHTILHTIRFFWERLSGPPATTEDISDEGAIKALHDALQAAPTATDDYRDPPPPWLAAEGSKT